MSAPKYRKKLVEDFSKMKVDTQHERPSHEIPRVSHRRDERTEIFETKVADKNMIKRNKLKTQMCKRFTETGYCHFGKGCHFAHYQSEIREAVCLFGDKCKDKKNCGYDHTTEEIPELPPVEKPAPKMWEVDISPVTKEEEMVIEL